ncbi:hypothetical protein RKD23_007966 [Streptomyces sp. SAI-170]|uniref:hypothetical protein n=1 Tax=Streptomyces sp. SAI-170 TaxID=3377729 RepID=UPI003C7BBAE4
MEQPQTDSDALKPRPDYPPKTPPPPKRPPSPPVPDRHEPAELVRVPAGRGRTLMKNRQGAAWSLEAQPWAGKQAVRHVAERLTAWGLAQPSSLEQVVRHLISAVVADGGRHISLHLAEQNHQALIIALSHQPDPAVLHESVLADLSGLGVASCGTEVTPEGRQIWAVLDLAS